MNLLRHPSGAALTLLASLASAFCSSASAQQSNTPADSLPSVTVTAPASRTGQANITGFGSTPSWQLPMQAQTITSTALKNSGAQRLADITSLDASISDSYNAPGYWDFLSVRGFTLDNAYNYRREGLPINAETSIPLDNKDAIEVLKGTSGIQAGVSSPGGLVNFLVKRPQGRVRSATLGFTGGNSILGSVDVSDRFGVDQAIGLRINAAYEHLEPNERHANGKRHLLALATDLRINPSNLIEFEIEHSRREQPSVTAFSLLGDSLPSAKSINPDINLNNQPWAMPVVMAATTGTLRWTHLLSPDWKLISTYGIQRLKSNDRTVFAYGCSSGIVYLGDRYCSDGTFDANDYDSENERRLTQALNVALKGQLKTGSVKHDLHVEALRSSYHLDVNNAAFNGIGQGDISGDYGPLPRDPRPLGPQHLRHHVSTELSVSDAVALSEQWRAWLGLRHSRLSRDTVLSDNSAPSVSTDQTFTTPWVGLGYSFAAQRQVYASWGEGVESKNAPESAPATYFFVPFTNAGQPLPSQKSRQVEVGVKGHENTWQWSLSAFRVHKPQDGILDTLPNPTYVIDGEAVHTGLEGQLQGRWGAWELNGSAMVLDAKRQGSSHADINGKQAVNVPEHTVKLSADYKVAALQGLTLQGQVVHEGKRMVLDDNSISIPSWTRFDTGLRYVQQAFSQQGSLTWRLGVRNLFDKRAWREAPKQFDHVYLFPLARRTVTASVQADF
ncbi:TonB-dependent siderophore receptor [Aquabacterium sp. CECT 9606]|uniref:TonB-dependent siderophore receptor n=1 Tax=Aquabacterium sp. CECT 9606 TaxID=2845822 RepID=UPI001E2ACB00|nr:TonB-dependent siderophore receptor [Aquabacterium sp. CECT 9606]